MPRRLEQLVAGKGRFDQAKVRARAPEFNRSSLDIRKWFLDGNGRVQLGGTEHSAESRVIVGGLFLLGLLGGPTLGILLAILVIPGQLITYPLTLAGLPNTTAAMVGLSTVLGGAGAVAFVPGLRGWLDGLLAKPSLRPVLAGALIWPILGQSLVTATILGLESVKPPAVAKAKQEQAEAANGAPGQAAAAADTAAKPDTPSNPGESEWKALLDPARGGRRNTPRGSRSRPDDGRRRPRRGGRDLCRSRRVGRPNRDSAALLRVASSLAGNPVPQPSNCMESQPMAIPIGRWRLPTTRWFSPGPTAL